MKITSVHKLVTWVRRKRDGVARQIAQREAYDRVLDRMDAFLRFHHDAWHDRRKR